MVHVFDRGQGRLSKGSATVYLDPVFLETAVVHSKRDLRIQVTPTGDCGGLYISGRTDRGYEVREANKGLCNLGFNWEVAAPLREESRERLPAVHIRQSD